MIERDDASAQESRLAGLERDLAGRDAELAGRDAQITRLEQRGRELVAQLAQARQLLLEQERQLLQLRRQLGRARGHGESEPPRSQAVPSMPPAEAHAEAERCLAEGIRLHRSGESKQATRQFQRGLALQPGHGDLLRALRRYA